MINTTMITYTYIYTPYLWTEVAIAADLTLNVVLGLAVSGEPNRLFL